MQKWMWIGILSTSLMLTGCATPTQGEGKKFTFDDKEMESKLIYFCQDKPELESMKIRAAKAHAYFTEQNNKNSKMLIEQMMNNKPKEEAMAKFNKNIETLAIDLNKKFSCMLVDTIDY